eukprot:gene4275-4990_t
MINSLPLTIAIQPGDKVQTLKSMIQKKIGIYTEYPVNLNALIDLFGSFAKVVEALARWIGANDLLDEIESLNNSLDIFEVAFRIPPDADDTACNLGLGHVLHGLKDHYPESCRKWNAINTNISTTIAKYQQYAYRPFSDNSNSNSIDPRTYYALEEFLDLWTTDMGHTPESLVLPVLPDGVTDLRLGCFNQPIVPGLLPNGLTSLTLGWKFNQAIAPGVLPNGLTSLTFENNFNQPIAPGVLPDGLTSL